MKESKTIQAQKISSSGLVPRCPTELLVDRSNKVFTSRQTFRTAEKVSMAQSYKALKEGFVSNLSGGEVSEVNYVTAVAPVRSIGVLSLLELIGKSL